METGEGIVKIEFRQSGGFAGLTKYLKIDSDEITAEELKSLESLVDQSKFFYVEEPVHITKPDEEQIYINIETEKRSRSMFMGRSELNDELKPLVKYLTKLARYEKK